MHIQHHSDIAVINVCIIIINYLYFIKITHMHIAALLIKFNARVNATENLLAAERAFTLEGECSLPFHAFPNPRPI
ncbi:hypothetical protein J4Q44_G00358390 [Coregonus suidteri]|uniref:Uncharacterized protein n=1 Tax=Coregonus suidteri TaxID=861788 RepID=A0AAN8KL13_9TELE